MADQAIAGEDAAAGGVPEGGAVRNRESTSQWRVQRYLGAHAELQGRWGTLIVIRHDGSQDLTLSLGADQAGGYVAVVRIATVERRRIHGRLR